MQVVDATAWDRDQHVRTVDAVLCDLELSHVPRVRVMNKCDRLRPDEVTILSRRSGALRVSAVSQETVEPLRDAIADAVGSRRRPALAAETAWRAESSSALVS